MTNRFACGLVVTTFLFAGLARAQTPTPTPDEHALKVAENAAPLIALAKELKAEAGRIHDPRLKKDALEILVRPRFTVLARREQEVEIRAALTTAGLLVPPPGAAAAVPPPLFPAHAPMAFLAAPASFWKQHHTYPGGLLQHTLVNLKVALGFVKTYHDVYKISLDEDLLRAAPIWHDSAKAMTIAWNADGTANESEGKIAGTGAHHVWAVAEAVYRGYPARFVVTLAAAHNPPIAGDGLESLVKYLKAAALIAGKPLSAAGLTDDGSALATDPPIEAFVHHLSDHDWVLAQVSLPKVLATLPRGADGSYWEAHRALAEQGDIGRYQKLVTAP